MEANKPNIEALSLSNLFNGKFLIPMFQRGYAWKEEQTKSLLEDLETFVSSDDCKNGEPYILGQIIVSPAEEEFKRFGYSHSLIDGQQRVTSLLLMFSALRRVVKDRSEANPSEDWSNELFQLQQLISFNQEAGRPRAPRLYSPYENSAEALQAIILMLQPSGEIENDGVQNLVDAYARFIEYFEESFLSTPELELKNYIDVVINSVYVTKLTLEDPRMALTIFEKINHRGLGLDDADLLKNMLFVNSDRSEFEALTKSWEKIRKDLKKINQTRLSNMNFLLRSLALRSGTSVSVSKLFDYWHKNIVKDRSFSPKDLTDLMSVEVKNLLSISQGKTPMGDDTEINYFTNLTRTFQHIPALMYSAKFSSDSYQFIAQCIEDRTVLFLLSGERTASFEKFIPLLMRTITDLSPDSTVDEIRAALQGMESGDDVKELLERSALGITSLSYQKPGDRRKQRYIISRVVRRANSDAGIRIFPVSEMMKQSRVNASFELDHVYPRSADPGLSNKEAIGNLVLLGAPLNRELQATLPLTKAKNDAYVASNNMINFALTLSASDDLPNSQKVVVDELRRKWTEAYVAVNGNQFANKPIESIVSTWNEDAVESVSMLYWGLFREQLAYI
jgi:uncharacterized protein with ParB-like and HNH nuclease domain